MMPNRLRSVGFAGIQAWRAANAATVVIVDPKTFNMDNLGKVGSVTLVSAIVGVALNLKQSPLPGKS